VPLLVNMRTAVKKHESEARPNGEKMGREIEEKLEHQDAWARYAESHGRGPSDMAAKSSDLFLSGSNQRSGGACRTMRRVLAELAHSRI
jgi:hypothetical protein